MRDKNKKIEYLSQRLASVKTSITHVEKSIAEYMDLADCYRAESDALVSEISRLEGKHL